MRDKQFRNADQNLRKKGLWDIMKWQFGAYNEPVIQAAPGHFIYPELKEEFNPNAPSCTWINHSTFLVRYHGINFLTDPIFMNRCSPFQWIGPKRKHPPALAIDELPEIHYVLISHDHYDHLCKKSVLELFQRFPKITWIVPHGVKKWFNKLGIEKVKEFSWWEQGIEKILSHPVEIVFTAVPAQHFSGRAMWHADRTLWCGWVVQFNSPLDKSPKQFYFVGDTGYNPTDFKKIGDRMGSMDLSMIPIGTYSPKAFMASIHIGPDSAVKIHTEVKSKRSIGMHWKTFKLSNEPMHQPPYDLYHEMVKNQLNPLDFLAVDPGRPTNW
jgi:N-acyl-phosphatidylethanolamine-hydrolysing phospholipase D